MRRVEPTQAATAKRVPGTGDFYWLQRGPIDDRDVVDADFRDCCESVASGIEERGGAAFALLHEGFNLADDAAEG